MNHPNLPEHPAQAADSPSLDASFGDILSEFERSAQREASPGETLTGRIISMTDQWVFVDIGRKHEGILAAEDLRALPGEIKAGDTIAVALTGRQQEGYVELSTVKVKRPKDWSSLENAFAEQTPVAGIVSEVIKGGLRVDVGVRAFLPASRSGVKDAAKMEQLVGQEIRCRVIQLDTTKEDVVLDRRVVLEEEEAETRRKVFEQLTEGRVVAGKVRSLTDFGAFVDLGGVDGLLHVGDMSWGRVTKPSDVLSVGEEIQVKILKADPASGRISLSRKQLLTDPWTVVADKYKQGDRVRGTVVRLVDFGAFVELEPGLEGLIHLSELSWSKKVRKPADVLKTGEAVEVLVLGVNPEQRRISLGLKQTLGDPWEDAVKRFPVGSVVEGPIANLANFGAFVDLGDGIEGMIHIGDITREKRLEHPREVLAVGQKVRAEVLQIDNERRRLRLGMKQLEPTSADEYIAERSVGDTVTGRFVEVGQKDAKVELGDGVRAYCRLTSAETERQETAAEAGRPDLGALTAMLSAKWKQGTSPRASQGESARVGQVRTFRIVSLDAEKKRIEVELAG